MRTRANILYVVDRSASMRCNLPPLQSSAACETSPQPVDAAQPTKWGVLNSALKSSIANLPPASSAGIVYFANNAQCGVSAQPNVPVAALDAAQLTALRTSLDAVTPDGQTPIVGAATVAYSHLFQAALNGNAFIVLITDGQETCAPSEVQRFLSQTVGNGVLVGIRTFAIGLPGSEGARGFLSIVAWNGGTPRDPSCEHSGSNFGNCHHDLTASGSSFAQQLAQALESVGYETASCEVALPLLADGGRFDTNRINVTLSPGGGAADEPLFHDTAGVCNGSLSGWHFNAQSTGIVLCGDACTTYRTRRSASVRFELGCATRIRVP